MRWEALVSAQNLKLAWRRIATGRNIQYKRFFREAYLVYESGLDANIRNLRAELRNGVWKPSHATRIHLPKPSGLQRPLSLLEIEDQIVLQAFANIVAKETLRKRRAVELDCVFSNILTKKSDSIFFTEIWQNTYKKFQEKCESLFQDGNTWVADFDLASYYDTISHDLLLRITSPNAMQSKSAKRISDWLQVWSSGQVATGTSHGIPQGPVASDYIAEAFFLPIDKELQRKDIKYVRYVDDIRIFGSSENAVRGAVIELEQKVRERGLIPQSSKFEIRKLRTAQEAIGKLPSLAPTHAKQSDGPELPDGLALSYLKASIQGRPQKIFDKSRFRYVAYRAAASTSFLALMLRLLPRHPEHIDAFVAYFNNYSKSRRVARSALNYLNTDLPYAYVRGELWHLVARLGSEREYSDGLELARADARKRSQCPALSWGVMHFLTKCDQKGIAKIGRRYRSEHPLSRSLLVPILPQREFSNKGIARDMLQGSTLEQTACAREMQKRSVSLVKLGLNHQDLPLSAGISLKCLGVIRRRNNSRKDWISQVFSSVYSCNKADIWRRLFGTEYEHALQISIEMQDRCQGSRSDWLSLQDSINDILTRELIGLLHRNGYLTNQSLVNRKNELVKYGSLIQLNSPFSNSYTSIADRFRTIHQRRNQLPGSHPYDQKGGARNRWLTKPEQTDLISRQRLALNDVIACVKVLPNS